MTTLGKWLDEACLTFDGHRFKKLNQRDLAAYFRMHPDEVFYAPLGPPGASITPATVSLV
jgi:hypothetical protein